jgi:hypothetical protein
MSSERLMQDLLKALGYIGAPGYIELGDLPKVVRHRHAFGEAFRLFGVVGIFGLSHKLNPAHRRPDYVPLVYVAKASGVAQAREIHRATWSQGIVPFLLIVTPDGVWSCNGLAFSSRHWESVAFSLPADNFVSNSPIPVEIAHLTSRNLRTSLVWTDREMGFDGRVDMRLLDNLKALTTILIRGDQQTPALPAALANALVGRFLYVRFLRDRKILPPNWIPLLAHAPMTSRSGSDKLLTDMWSSFARIERVFNGSIFPILSDYHSMIVPRHAELLCSVVLDDADFVGERGLQLSFREFRFSSIRTETLSAVYELFLKTSALNDRVADGAIYTPPFLVDFVLSQMERDTKLFESQDRVLDCAAGSGVFLVGTFRRIVESTLFGKSGETLPLSKLHEILRRCIWGVELNIDACYVAAFSLYLTMLDYLSRDELEKVIGFEGRRKIFLSLVGRNILARDFFDPAPFPRGVPRTFTAVVANPPWEKTSKIGMHALAYQQGPRGQAIDHGRASGLFFWKAIDNHLDKTGRFGFVMSGRALLSSGAARFPKQIVSEVGMTCISNLSHMRRKLFPRAEHPATVIVGYKEKSTAGDGVRIFAPLLSSQPVSKDGTPWVIIEDRCEVEVFRRDHLKDVSTLIEALTLRPVDRQLIRWLEDSAVAGRCATLGRILDRYGLSMKRGGYLPETHVPPQYTLGANPNKRNYYRTALQLDDTGLLQKTMYKLPRSIAVAPEYAAQFAGNIIVIPRSMTHIDFVAQPFAFNSSINAIFSMERTPEQVEVLRSLARYLQSAFANYCFTLFGRDWALDERRLEQKELRRIPVPREFLDLRAMQEFAGQFDMDREEAIYKAFSLSRNFRLAAKEFDSFRYEFQNGRIPPGVHARPNAGELDIYIEVLEREMSAYVGSNRKFTAQVARFDDRSLAVVALKYIRDHGPNKAVRSPIQALAAFDEVAANVFQDSAWSSYDQSTTQFSVVKPLSRLHWTVERAFADADRMLTEIVPIKRKAVAA